MFWLLVLILHYALNSWEAAKFRSTAVSNAIGIYFSVQVDCVDILYVSLASASNRTEAFIMYIARAASSTFPERLARFGARIHRSSSQFTMP